MKIGTKQLTEKENGELEELLKRKSRGVFGNEFLKYLGEYILWQWRRSGNPEVYEYDLEKFLWEKLKRKIKLSSLKLCKKEDIFRKWLDELVELGIINRAYEKYYGKKVKRKYSLNCLRISYSGIVRFDFLKEGLSESGQKEFVERFQAEIEKEILREPETSISGLIDINELIEVAEKKGEPEKPYFVGDPDPYFNFIYYGRCIEREIQKDILDKITHDERHILIQSKSGWGKSTLLYQLGLELWKKTYRVFFARAFDFNIASIDLLPEKSIIIVDNVKNTNAEKICEFIKTLAQFKKNVIVIMASAFEDWYFLGRPIINKDFINTYGIKDFELKFTLEEAKQFKKIFPEKSEMELEKLYHEAESSFLYFIVKLAYPEGIEKIKRDYLSLDKDDSRRVYAMVSYIYQEGIEAPIEIFEGDEIILDELKRKRLIYSGIIKDRIRGEHRKFAEIVVEYAHESSPFSFANWISKLLEKIIQFVLIHPENLFEYSYLIERAFYVAVRRRNENLFKLVLNFIENMKEPIPRSPLDRFPIYFNLVFEIPDEEWQNQFIESMSNRLEQSFIESDSIRNNHLESYLKSKGIYSFPPFKNNQIFESFLFTIYENRPFTSKPKPAYDASFASTMRKLLIRNKKILQNGFEIEFEKINYLIESYSITKDSSLLDFIGHNINIIKLELELFSEISSETTKEVFNNLNEVIEKTIANSSPYPAINNIVKRICDVEF
jgi:hypothetical protein